MTAIMVCAGVGSILSSIGVNPETHESLLLLESEVIHRSLLESEGVRVATLIGLPVLVVNLALNVVE